MSIYNELEESEPILLFPEKEIESKIKSELQQKANKLLDLNHQFKRVDKENRELKLKLKEFEVREWFLNDKNMELTQALKETLESSKKYSEDQSCFHALDSKLKEIKTKLLSCQIENLEFEKKSKQLNEDNKALEEKYQVKVEHMRSVNIKVTQKLDNLFEFCKSDCGENMNEKRENLCKQIERMKEILK